jgi:hypothetical protein
MSAAMFDATIPILYGDDSDMSINDVAVCPALNIFAVAGNKLRADVSVVEVYDLDPDALLVGKSPRKRCVLGASLDVAPMKFSFGTFQESGKMAFTDVSNTQPYLLVLTDLQHDSVHVIDVLTQTHVGYVGCPGFVVKPAALATHASLVAMTTRIDTDIWVYSGGGAKWSVRCRLRFNYIPVFEHVSCALRFTRDGTKLVAADARGSNSMLHVFHVESRTYNASLCTPGSVTDFEECGDAWLVSALYKGVLVINKNPFAGIPEEVASIPCSATSLALFSRGCFVATRLKHSYNHGRDLHVLTSRDAISMAGMSTMRTAWMVAAARAVQRRCDACSGWYGKSFL